MLNTILATDVRQTLDRFRSSVDEMFDSFYGYRGQPSADADSRDRVSIFSPLIESGWSENSLNLRAILPGVSESDVRVSVQNNQLIIEGDRKLPEGFEQRAYRQLAYGQFYTAVTLPSGLDGEHIECNLHHGVLDIRVPVAEASKPRQIHIQTANQQKSVPA
jgi:HSP20 family protein